VEPGPAQSFLAPRRTARSTVADQPEDEFLTVNEVAQTAQPSVWDGHIPEPREPS
jgi:hypothetical protein